MTILETAPAPAGEPHPDPALAGEMTWLEHLGELRRRLLICVAALAVGTVAAWFLYDHLLGFMISPYRDYLAHHPGKDISHGNLVATGPLEGFSTRLKVSGYAGAVFGAPVWIYQAWRFIAPGLHRQERRYSATFVGSAIALFTLGVATAVLVFPKAVSWMISVSGTGIVPLFSPGRYLGLYTMACLIFGVVFTYPVFLVGLEVVGILSSSRLRHWRRYAILGCCVIAAFITPSSDPFSFLAMAVPMVVFYEASILIGRVLGK